MPSVEYDEGIPFDAVQALCMGIGCTTKGLVPIISEHQGRAASLSEE